MKKTFAFLKDLIMSFLNNKCSMHAAGLTYFALLAIIPVLCCVLVAAKACKVDQIAREQINMRIDAFIEEIEKGQDDKIAQYLPSKSDEEREKKRIAAKELATTARNISSELFKRVEQFDVGTLGWIGFGFLLWTVISSLASVESSFNQIWDVPEARKIWKRAYMYLFIMIVLPVLATVAMSLPVLNVAKNVIVCTLGATWLTQWVSDGLVWLLDSWVFRFAFSFASASVAFAFFLWVMPNCKVRLRYAWYGGAITALLFCGWLKACAVAQIGIAKSSALYGSFAFLPIVLAWLYMSWQIVLLGANMVRAFETAERIAK